MTRQTKKTIINPTRQQAEDAMQELAKSNSALKGLESKIESEKQKIDEKYKDKIIELQETITHNMEVVEVWAKKDCANWGAKSFDLTAGTCGFRTGTPKVEKDKKFNWGAITQLLAENFPFLVRTKTEPDKEAIIALRDDPQFKEVAKKCYIQVVQDETFYVQPKEEELTTV